MSRLYNQFWIRITIVLTAIAIVIGFPVLQLNLKFPDSIIWGFALLLAIWAAYFIRVYLLTRFYEPDAY